MYNIRQGDKMSLLKNNKNRSIYTQIVLFYTVSLSILILILSISLYISYAKSSYDNYRKNDEKVLSQITYSATYMNDLAKDFCLTAYTDTEVINLLYSDKLDYFVMGNSLKGLRNQVSSHPYIHSVTVYNSKLNNYMSTVSSFSNSHNLYDKSLIDIIENIDSNSLKLKPIPRKIPLYNSSTNSFSYVYTYLIFNNIKDSSDANSVMAVNMNVEWLSETIDSLDLNTVNNNNIFVINEDGIVINHNSSDMFLQDISSYSYINNILTSNKKTDSLITDIDNQRSILTYTTLDLTGWKFISITPYGSIVSTTRNILILTIFICLIIISIGILISVILSKKIYSPINTLVANLKEKMNYNNVSIKDTSEMNFLSNTFSTIITKMDYLDQIERNSFQSAKNNYLLSLLWDGSSALTSSRRYRHIALNIDFEESLFLFMFKIDNYHEFLSNNSQNDRLLLKFAIDNIASEILSQTYKNELINMNNDKMVVLIQLKNNKVKDEVLYKELTPIINKIQEYLSDNFDLSLTTSLGYAIDNIDELYKVYDQVETLSMYRIIYGHKSILTPTIFNNINNDFKLFTKKQKMLVESLKLGNIKKAIDIYYDIINVITSYSHDNFIASLINLTFYIYNNFYTIIQNNYINLSFFFVEFLNNIESRYETIEEINKIFIHLFEDIILSIDNSNNNKSNKIVNNILAIIDQKYSDKNLCSQSIADLLKMSASYLRKLFKETTGKSISESIKHKRMQELKRLLDTTELNTDVILDKVGLEKSNYFYTTFKKYFGVSLSNYRLNKLNKTKELK